MKSVRPLIELAAKACGSYEVLAEKLGTSPAAISHMKSGKRPISPETAAELADLAGTDVQWAVFMALIERNAGSEKGERLARILGEARCATGGAKPQTLGFSQNGLPETLSGWGSPVIVKLTKYTLWKPRRGHWQQPDRHGACRPIPQPRTPTGWPTRGRSGSPYVFSKEGIPQSRSTRREVGC